MIKPHNLPIEIVNKIINYTNVVSFRTGKYIDRISKTDVRYEMLAKIVKPVKLGKRVLINLINYANNEPRGYFIEYIFDKWTKVNINYVSINKYNEIISHSSFISMRDANGICRKYVRYAF